MNANYRLFLFAVLVAFIVLAFVRFHWLDATLLVLGVYLVMPQLRFER